MHTEAFDLNDARHEPTDEQLQGLMEAVAEQARRREQASREKLLEELRTETDKTLRKWGLK